MIDAEPCRHPGSAAIVDRFCSGIKGEPKIEQPCSLGSGRRRFRPAQEAQSPPQVAGRCGDGGRRRRSNRRQWFPGDFPGGQLADLLRPGLRRQWWHRFADARHKHVFALRPVGDGTWLLVEPWWTRLMVNVLTLDEAIKFLRWGSVGNILKVRESIPGEGQPDAWVVQLQRADRLPPRPVVLDVDTERSVSAVAARAGTVEIDLSQFLGRHFQVETNRSANATH